MSDNTKKTIIKHVIFLGIFCVSAEFTAVEAASPKRYVKEGNRLYQKGEYTASREKYAEALKEAPESDIINFNFGTALYKEGEYEDAANHFQKVFLSEDEDLKGKAHYNLGNALYKSGAAHEDDDMALAVSSLEKSLAQYEEALTIDEDDEDAKHNYAYVQGELERLKEKQKQQEQKQSQEQSQQQPGGSGDQRQQQQAQDRQSQEGQDQEGQEGRQQDGQTEQQQGQDDQRDQQKQEGQLSDQQEISDQGGAPTGEKGHDKQQGTGVPPQNAQELTQEEARMLLDNYQRTEEPQGLLNARPKSSDGRPVLKDW